MTKTNSTPKRFCMFGILTMLSLTLLLYCSGGGGGTGEATEVATKAYDAFRQADWETYASWMHPEALGRYESILRPVFDAVIQVDSTGNMPGEFKWFDSTINTEEFLNMTPKDFFAFSMTEIVAAVPGLGEALRGSSLEVIGEIGEGDRLVHVVVRTSAESMGMGMTEVSVLTTAKSEGEYRLMLSGQIESIATAIARGMGGR